MLKALLLWMVIASVLFVLSFVAMSVTENQSQNPTTSTSTPNSAISEPEMPPPEPPTHLGSVVETRTNDLYDVMADSPVYQEPDETSPVLSWVHQGRTLHVIGITDGWLQIRKRNGTVGFVPDKFARYKTHWID